MIRDINSRFFRCLLGYQSKRRKLAQKMGAGTNQASSKITYIEESILKIIEENENSNVKELAQLTHLERSWISRMVTSLEERNLISSKPSIEDKRNKLLKITKSGIKAIEELNSFLTEVISLSMKSLKKDEIEFIEEVLSAFTDSLVKFKEKKTHGNIIHHQLHRMSRELGVFGDNFLDLNINLIQLWIFVCVAEKSTTNLNELKEEIPFDLSNISRNIQNLTDNNFLTKTASLEDKRISFISLSTKGEKFYNTLVEEIITRFSGATKIIGEKKINKLIELFDKLNSESLLLDDGFKYEIKINHDNQNKLHKIEHKELKNKFSIELLDSKQIIGNAELLTNKDFSLKEIKISGKDLTKDDFSFILDFMIKLGEKNKYSNI